MSERQPPHHVSRSDSLWQQPSLCGGEEEQELYESALFAPLHLDLSTVKFDHPYASKHDLDRDLRLPGLDTFEFGPLPELDTPDESTVSIDAPPLEPAEDVWEVAFELGPANKDVRFFTWESFEKGQHVDEQAPYITERGPEAFDAALACDHDKISAGQIIKGSVLLQSLWNLGLGRSSILFQFNPKSKTFEPAVVDGRASGVSLRAAQSLVAQFIHIGNTFLYLKSFAERAFTSASSIPARVALATAVSTILSSLEDTLGQRSSQIVSFIQLQDHFGKPREILTHVARMVDAAKFAKTNEQLASILHHRLLELEEGQHYLRQLTCQVLSLVSGPSLELIAEWSGLRQEQAIEPIWQRNSFVTVEDASVDASSLEFTYRSEMMPRFISPEDGNMIFEIGSSLHVLRTQHPEHPLARFRTSTIKPPDLDWTFAWKDIEMTTRKAKAYEDALRQTLLEYSKGSYGGTAGPAQSTTPSLAETASDEKSKTETDFEEAMRCMDLAPGKTTQLLPDELQMLVSEIVNDDGHQADPLPAFSPPLSLASALSFRPLLAAQAKLVNAATIRLFLRTYNLRHHLTLQRQYHLLGDGVFSSLLATALFDPDRESAERHKGQMRSGVHMGLQLGSRKSWPPASSELRLALRGVLSESYHASALYQGSLGRSESTAKDHLLNGRDNDELPGQLNFAIRNLTEAEQEKVMDPDALSALDFLRLQYLAPTPLHLIITSALLEKYDLIFKFLLRLLRLLYLVSHLPRQYADVESTQFRLEAHHFVSMLANYVFQTGITEHWNDFDTFVSTIETRINLEDAAGEIGVRVTEGIASLRDAHEKCLDSIMFSLLLRKRQRKIMALIDEIFEHVLLFAKVQRAGEVGGADVKDIHAQLSGKIRVFLSVCRGLTGKKGYGTGRSTVEENSMERLVMSMEMNGYFGG
ncbi:hypothetical protein ACN47E_007448 [Coniothyrium glycines]